MTDSQFTAVAHLLRLRPTEQTAALRALMVEGLSQAEAARRHGVSASQLHRALLVFRGNVATAKAIADVLK